MHCMLPNVSTPISWPWIVRIHWYPHNHCYLCQDRGVSIYPCTNSWIISCFPCDFGHCILFSLHILGSDWYVYNSPFSWWEWLKKTWPPDIQWMHSLNSGWPSFILRLVYSCNLVLYSWYGRSTESGHSTSIAPYVPNGKPMGKSVGNPWTHTQGIGSVRVEKPNPYPYPTIPYL